jgi:hypothetical protein
MEIRIVVFLALVGFSAIINTVLIFLAYKMLAGATTKITAGVTEFGKNSETRQWLESMKAIAEQTATVTESTKVKMLEFDETLGRTQKNYRRTLETVDSGLEAVADTITKTSEAIRDAVAKPAFSVSSFASGLGSMLRDD